jgi:membrane protein insertase Oxa1/YidC/SpoIIIJ
MTRYISKLEIYLQGGFNALLMIVPWFVDFIDPILKTLSVMAGIILTVFLIRKASHDINSKKLDNELKRIQIDKEHQELHQLMERNKKRKE